MKVCVIGGNGQIGNYLLPRLVQSGYETISVTRGNAKYFRECPEFAQVEEVHLTRGEDGFEEAVAAIGADIVVDIICFTADEMRKLTDVLFGKVQQYITVGSIWIHGKSEAVPCREEEARTAFDAYGIGKLEMSDAVHSLWEEKGFPVTIIHPGHIVAPGSAGVVGPQGNRNPKIYEDLRDGRNVPLPNLGQETLHHVHADDVAKMIIAAMEKGEKTFGEEYHAVTQRAVSLYGLCRMVAGFFGKEADLSYVPVESFKELVPRVFFEETLEHITRSPSASPEKAIRDLGIVPKTTEETMREHLAALGML